MSVLTHLYDQQRTGANLAESTLNPSNVRTGLFGNIFYRPLDGTVCGQPLIVANLKVGGKTRNVLYVVTKTPSVYAFDADDPDALAPLWRTHFAAKIGTSCSTPIISMETNSIYVTSRTSDASNHITFLLHALDLTTGAEKFNGPVAIQATVQGTGVGSDGQGYLAFEPSKHLQRPALAISNGQLYIAFASIMDVNPYHGWIFTYDIATLHQTSVYCTSPNQSMVGIWMSSQAPVVDAQGNVYFVSGNASSKAPVSPLGNSVLKFAAGTTNLVDTFTPFNTATLNKYDLDLGCGGIMQLPGTNLVVTGSKQSKLFVLNSNNLGGKGTTDDSNAYQAFQAGNGHVHGSPVAYNSAAGLLVYVWPENDKLKAFLFRNGYFEVSAYAESQFEDPTGMPGAMLSISANGATPGSGVLWALLPFIGNAEFNMTPGVLRAFDPVSLRELWNSGSLAQDIGLFAKFVPPVVANGKVYVASSDPLIQVYGLLGSFHPQPPQTVLTSSGNGLARVYWTASPNAYGYNVMRSLNATGPFTLLKSTTGTSIIDTGLVAGKRYYYEVVAINSAGQSVPSSTGFASSTKTVAPTVSYSSARTTSSFHLNGSAEADDDGIWLTDGSSAKSGSFYYSSTVSGASFHTTFDFQFPKAGAEGFTFVLQHATTTASRLTSALGGNGKALGYGPDSVKGLAVRSSVAVRFSLRDSVTDTPASSTGLFMNGWTTGAPTTDLAGSGIDFNNGDHFNASLAYDGVTLTVTITDKNTNAVAVQLYVVSIPSCMLTSKGYAGFTGATGDEGGSIEILNWIFGP